MLLFVLPIYTLVLSGYVAHLLRRDHQGKFLNALFILVLMLVCVSSWQVLTEIDRLFFPGVFFFELPVLRALVIRVMLAIAITPIAWRLR